MNWVVTVPLWRAGKGVPIKERLEQLERLKAMTGHYAKLFATEAEAKETAYLWSQAFGSSVEAKFKPPIPTDEEQS